jgi:hypothetical protein
MLSDLIGGDDMEMDMQEPGEMCCCYQEAHDPAARRGKLSATAAMPARVSHIIISYRSIASCV